MEALSSLTFKGSVTEAIFETKGQKKLFVVYISGEDEDSDKLNKLTWIDKSVAESLSKYCILLHIPSGSVDAANFSAIYPYSSVPCIAAIGFSGTQVWKSEGFITAEDLASSLEKAWLGLHIQETTASIFSAALASQNSGQPISSASNVVSPSDGSSLDAVVASQPTRTSVQPSVGESSMTSAQARESNDGTAAAKGKESAEPSNMCGSSINQPLSCDDGTKDKVEHKATHTSSSFEAEEESSLPAASRTNDNTSTVRSSTDGKRKQDPVMKKPDSGSGVSERDINLSKSVVTKEAIKPKDERKEEYQEIFKNLSDVHLNIRLPDGGGLQEKFSVTSTLRIVKDYVSSSNQTTGLGAYDLAVPYPRKVYSDQDLDKSLSELGLFDRQALVVVPRKRATVYQRGPSYSESNNTDPANNNGGYFAYFRRLLSYVNPFSYLGGSTANATSSSPESQRRPNPELRTNLAQAGSSSSPSEGRSNVRRRPTTSRIGSNIHTLKHDEDDTSFGDGNAFWNGNSTQYGGGSGGDGNDKR